MREWSEEQLLPYGRGKRQRKLQREGTLSEGPATIAVGWIPPLPDSLSLATDAQDWRKEETAGWGPKQPDVGLSLRLGTSHGKEG